MTDMLTRILNTLMMIETRGENTVLMGQCLQALQEVINQMKQQEMAADSNTEVEE